MFNFRAGDDKVPEVSLLGGTKEEEGLTDNPIAPRGGGGKKGRKERKKKAFDDEWYIHNWPPLKLHSAPTNSRLTVAMANIIVTA